MYKQEYQWGIQYIFMSAHQEFDFEKYTCTIEQWWMFAAKWQNKLDN